MVEELEWRGTFPEGLEIRGLTLAFSHTWTTILAVRIETSKGVKEFELVDGFTAVGDWRDDVLTSTGEEVLLTVEYEGGPARAINVVIDADKSEASLTSWYPVTVDPTAELPKEACQLLWALELERLALPTELSPAYAALSGGGDGPAVFQERSRALDYDAAVKRAWFELDRDTNPDMVHDEWAITLNELGYRLAKRLELRSFFGKDCLWPVFGAETEDNRKAATQVSAVFRRCMLSLEAESRQDLVDWAFELFVTGRVVTRHNDMLWQALLLTHGSPDSAHFLKFAELAILCLEHGIDADFWKKHLRTMVRTAHIFLEAACPLKDNPYPMFAKDFKLDPDRYYPRSRRVALRLEYETAAGAGLGWGAEFDALRARFGSLVGTAIKEPDVLSSGEPTDDILGEHVATLIPLGVGTPKTQVCPLPDAS